MVDQLFLSPFVPFSFPVVNVYAHWLICMSVSWAISICYWLYGWVRLCVCVCELVVAGCHRMHEYLRDFFAC